MERRTTLLQGYRIIILLSITACVRGSCDLNGITSCATGIDFSDLANLCPTITKIKQCLAPFRESCKGNKAYTAIVTPLARAGSVCGNTDSGSSACNLLGVSSCVTGVDFSNVSKICLSIPKIKQCIAPFKRSCEGNAAFGSLASPLKQAESFCGDSGSSSCNLLGVSSCVTGVDFSDVSKVCVSIPKIKRCIAPFKTSCEGNAAFGSLAAPLAQTESFCGGTGSKTCNVSALSACRTEVDFSDISTICPTIAVLRQCIAPFTKSCKGNSVYLGFEQRLRRIGSQCRSNGCSLKELYHCTSLLKGGIRLDSFPTADKLTHLCKMGNSLVSCVNPFKKTCSKVKNRNIRTAMQRIKNQTAMITAFCRNDILDGFKRHTNCFQTSSVQYSVESCLPNFESANDDDDDQSKIPDDQICSRWQDVETCVNKAVTATCGSSATDFIVNFLKIYAKSMMLRLGDEKLSCLSTNGDSAHIMSPSSNGAERTLPRLSWIRMWTSLPFILTLYMHIGI